jgi:methyl-accepting chemotaxis protein
MDQMIQQNASAAEEMSSTSEELSGQAEQLQNAISFFRIDSHWVSDSALIAQKVKNASYSPALESGTNRGLEFLCSSH